MRNGKTELKWTFDWHLILNESVSPSYWHPSFSLNYYNYYFFFMPSWLWCMGNYFVIPSYTKLINNNTFWRKHLDSVLLCLFFISCCLWSLHVNYVSSCLLFLKENALSEKSKLCWNVTLAIHYSFLYNVFIYIV